MPVKENKAIVEAHSKELYKRKIGDVILKYYAPDAVYRDVTSPGQTWKPEAAARAMSGAFAAFPDATDTIDDIFAEGDRVAVRHTFRGTHKGEFAGIPPSGKAVVSEGMYITRLDKGKIVEVWGAWDLAASVRKAADTPEP